MHVGSTVMVIENHNGENHRRGYHEHDTIEVRPCSTNPGSVPNGERERERKRKDL